MYDKNGKPTIEDLELEADSAVEEDNRGPLLLESEIRAALNEMKNKKAEVLMIFLQNCGKL